MSTAPDQSHLAAALQAVAKHGDDFKRLVDCEDATLRRKMAFRLVKSGSLGREDASSFLTHLVDLCRQKKPGERPTSRHYREYIGSFIDTKTNGGKIVETWLLRSLFFETLDRLAPSVLERLRDVALEPYQRFRRLNGDCDPTLYWDLRGQHNCDSYLPMAILCDQFSDWLARSNAAAKPLGIAIRRWMNAYHLTPSDDDPLWLIEMAIYNLRSLEREPRTNSWRVPVLTFREPLFDERGPAILPFSPEKSSVSGYRTYAREQIEKYIEERQAEAKQMKELGALRSTRRIAPEQLGFDDLVHYQVLGFDRNRADKASCLTKSPSAFHTANTRLAGRLGIKKRARADHSSLEDRERDLLGAGYRKDAA